MTTMINALHNSIDVLVKLTIILALINASIWLWIP